MGIFFGPPDVRKLWERGDAKGLKKAVGHKDLRIQWEAALALGTIAEMRYWDDLLLVLMTDARSLDVLAAFLDVKAGHFLFRHVLFMLGRNQMIYQNEAITIGQQSVRRGEFVGRIIASLLDRLVDVLLNHESPESRRIAADILARSPDARALDPLVAALRDHDPSVREAAAQALENLKDARAVEPLFHAFASDFQSKEKGASANPVWYGIARALGTLASGNAAVAATLIEHFVQGDMFDRQALRGPLMDLGVVTVRPMIDLLRHSSPELRKEAASHLGRLRSADAVPPLVQSLGDEGRWTFFGEEQEVSYSVQKALAEIGQPAVSSLSAALGHSDPRIRDLASKALQEIGGPEAEQALKGMKRDSPR